MILHQRNGKDLEIYNLSELEDIPGGLDIIGELVAKAGKSAAIEAKVAGLSEIFVRNNQLVRVLPNGKEEIIAVDFPKGNKFYITYKPATILHVGKK